MLPARSVSWANSSSSAALRLASARGRSKKRPYSHRFSCTVSSVSSVSSWGTTPMRARIWAPWVAASRPNRRRVPLEAGETQPIMRIVLLLPAPLGPRKPNASPRRTSTSMPATAVKSPKRFTSWLATMSGLEGSGAADITGHTIEQGSIVAGFPPLGVALYGMRMGRCGGPGGMAVVEAVLGGAVGVLVAGLGGWWLVRADVTTIDAPATACASPCASPASPPASNPSCASRQPVQQAASIGSWCRPSGHRSHLRRPGHHARVLDHGALASADAATGCKPTRSDAGSTVMW